jgi:hypothetical protein
VGTYVRIFERLSGRPKEERMSMIGSTWQERELRILAAVCEAQERGADMDTINRNARAAVPDLSRGVYQETVASLIEDGQLEGMLDRGGMSQVTTVAIERLTPTGRRAVGQWPAGDLAGLLVTALHGRADEETDAGERTKLQRAAAALAGLSKDVLTDVLAAVIKAQAGVG